MIHYRSMNNKINYLLERSFRTIYKDSILLITYFFSFYNLLKRILNINLVSLKDICITHFMIHYVLRIHHIMYLLYIHHLKNPFKRRIPPFLFVPLDSILHEFTISLDEPKTDKKRYVDIANLIDGKDGETDGSCYLNPSFKFPV